MLCGMFCALLLSTVAPNVAQTTVESFTGGSNLGGWTFGGPNPAIPPSGGNPGAYLASGLLDTFAPQPRTTASGTPFTGDFRAASVSSIGIDLITFEAGTTAGRPLTLMLIHDNGTGSFADDTAAYFFGPNIPAVGAGWKSYDFSVPSAEVSLPSGWQLLNLGDSGAPPIHDWDTVIQNVSRIQFFYGDPTLFFIFQQWMLGMDNPRVSAVACSPSAGAVPDGATVPGGMMTVTETAGGQLRLRWQDSCGPCDTDFEVYEGVLGDFDSHVQKLCTTNGIKQAQFTPSIGSAYYIVVPHNGQREGSYGSDGDGIERPAALASCLPQSFAGCP
jgi:hypothetical protein